MVKLSYGTKSKYNITKNIAKLIDKIGSDIVLRNCKLLNIKI